jgi:hypothetical protein
MQMFIQNRTLPGKQGAKERGGADFQPGIGSSQAYSF